jgi:hypothetical protein
LFDLAKPMDKPVSKTTETVSVMNLIIHTSYQIFLRMQELFSTLPQMVILVYN